MGWQINKVKNTLKFNEECAKELVPVLVEDVAYDENDAINIVQGGQFYFNPDHLEHMDFLWNEKIQKILNKHKAKGEVCFSSEEGD